jgi:hypothetical protein
VRPVRRLGTPLVDLLSPTPYVAFQASIDDTVPHGWHYYWKSTNLTGLSEDAIAVIADHAYSASSPRSYSAMFHMGGAVTRVPHALQPHRAGSVYVNFLDSDDDTSRVREAYGDHIYRRLAEVKAKYDPDNAFHHNKNIRPR